MKHTIESSHNRIKNYSLLLKEMNKNYIKSVNMSYECIAQASQAFEQKMKDEGIGFDYMAEMVLIDGSSWEVKVWDFTATLILDQQFKYEQEAWRSLANLSTRIKVAVKVNGCEFMCNTQALESFLKLSEALFEYFLNRK